MQAEGVTKLINAHGVSCETEYHLCYYGIRV